MKWSIFTASPSLSSPQLENSSTKPPLFTSPGIHKHIMEKQITRRKSKLLRYLPRAASAVSFQNPVFSPGRDKHRFYSPALAGFSGPIVSIVPDEARRRPRKGANDDDDGEPTSPKVSCIGQIKLHKEKKKKMIVFKKADDKRSVARSASRSHHRRKQHHDKQFEHHDHDKHGEEKKKSKPKKQDSKIFKLFGVGFGSRGSRSAEKSVDPEVSTAPSLGQIRRFSSGRQALANFDWTAQIAPMNDLDSRNCHSDDEFGFAGDDGEEEKEVIIPHSAPIVMGLGDLKREDNLWQRRNTASSPSLEVKQIRVRTK